MSTSNVADIVQLLIRTHGGLLPKVVKVLVHLSECRTKESPGDCTAMCLQYPVHAKADTPDEAVTKVLLNLVGYLAGCEEMGCFAPCWAEKVYQIAFDYGDNMALPNAIDARITEALQGHLGLEQKASLESLVYIRDVRSFQQEAYGDSVEELFGPLAA